VSLALRMSAAELTASLKAFDAIQRHRDLTEPGRNNCRRVLSTHNRGRRVRQWSAVAV